MGWTNYPLGTLGSKGNGLLSAGALSEFVRTRRNQRERLTETLKMLRNVSRDEYSRWSAQERKAFDHRRIEAATVMTVLETPAITKIKQAVEELLVRAEFGGSTGIGGVLIRGPGGVGKTTAATVVARTVYENLMFKHFGQDWWQHDVVNLRVLSTSPERHNVEAQMVPVLPVSLGADFGARQFRNLVDESFASVGVQIVAGGTAHEHVAAMSRKIQACHTVLVVIDEVHFFGRGSIGTSTVHNFKSLINSTNAVYLLAGVPDASGRIGVFDGGRSEVTEQLSRRFIKFDLERLSMSECAGFVRTFAWKLVLLDSGPYDWISDEILELIYLKTHGYPVHLYTLLETASVRAIGKSETITLADLEAIPVSIEADDRNWVAPPKINQYGGSGSDTSGKAAAKPADKKPKGKGKSTGRGNSAARKRGTDVAAAVNRQNKPKRSKPR